MNRIDVHFDSAGIAIAGHLYVPAAASAGRGPAVVVGHPGSGVKEQAAGDYARMLSEKGFVALAFDAAHQGESGGEPRGLEDPAHRIEDIKAAVSYLGRRPEVDADRIGVVGICASGGYVLPATASDHRIKAVAAVSPVDIARQFRYGPDGTQDPAVFDAMLDAAAEARSAAAAGAAARTFPLFPESAAAAQSLGGQHAAEGFQYYCTGRACHPRSAKELTWSSIDKIATFDAFAPVGLLGARPLLMIVGRRAVTAWMAVEVYQNVIGPKELVWVDDASHVDLYDKGEYVRPAVDELARFFGTHLAEHA